MSAPAAPGFTLTAFHNEHLPDGATDVDAIVEVRATGAAGGPAPAAAQVIVIDCSGSMNDPVDKILAARRATRAALDALPDGVLVAVVAGRHDARMVFPTAGERLVVLDANTRRAAQGALDQVTPSGGTAIGTWLDLARRLLAAHRDRIRHALLLTDGRNEHERPEQLVASLAACEGVFTCDARGIGTAWEVDEVRGIATRLLGNADIVADPADLDTDFTGIVARAMGKQVGEVGLRVWAPKDATVQWVKQVSPSLVDLTGRREPDAVKLLLGHYPTGAWGDETREYHLRVSVPPLPVGETMLAARVAVMVDGTPVAESRVPVRWTSDLARSTQLNPRVQHYTGQAELVEAIQDGLEARRTGDVTTATARLGRAKEIADESGNATTAALLGKVVETDPGTGRVRLRTAVSDVDEMTLDVQSTRTAQVVRRREG